MILVIICKNGFRLEEGLIKIGFDEDTHFVNFWSNKGLIKKIKVKSPLFENN